MVLLREADMFDVTCGVKDSDHFDARICGSKVKAIFFEWIAATACSEFGPWPSNGVPPSKVFKF